MPGEGGFFIMTAFATAAELLERYDYRVLGQLLSDTGTALTSGEIIASSVTAAMLADASGMIVSYVVKGGRYSEADLEALTGNGANFLKRLTCDLAMYCILMRRGLPVDNYPQVVDGLTLLMQLSEGKIIFPVQANIDAGHASSDAISIQTIVDNNYLVDSVRYFPTRRLTQDQLG